MMPLALTLTERLGDPTLCAGISPQYHLSAVGIDSNTGMIVLVDGNKDFALRAVLVHRSDFKINGKKRSYCCALKTTHHPVSASSRRSLR